MDSPNFQPSPDHELSTIPPRFKRTVQTIFAIPAQLRTELSPSNDLSLRALTDLSLPLQAQQHHSTKASSTADFFSKNAPSKQIPTSYLAKLRHLATPDTTTIQQLAKFSHRAWLDGFQSIHFAHLDNSLPLSESDSENVAYFPMWVITYWQGVMEIKEMRSHWIK